MAAAWKATMESSSETLGPRRIPRRTRRLCKERHNTPLKAFVPATMSETTLPMRSGCAVRSPMMLIRPPSGCIDQSRSRAGPHSGRISPKPVTRNRRGRGFSLAHGASAGAGGPSRPAGSSRSRTWAFRASGARSSGPRDREIEADATLVPVDADERPAEPRAVLRPHGARPVAARRLDLHDVRRRGRRGACAQ